MKKFFGRILLSIAAAAISSFYMWQVLNNTVGHAEFLIARAQSAGTFRRLATTLPDVLAPGNSSDAAYTKEQLKNDLPVGVVQSEFSTFLTGAEDYFKHNGRMPEPALSKTLAKYQDGTTPTNTKAWESVRQRYLLVHDWSLPVLGLGVVLAIAYVLLHYKAAYRALAGLCVQLILGLATWYLVLKTAPGLIASRLQLGSGFAPLEAIIHDYLTAVCVAINKQVLIAMLVVGAIGIGCFVAGIVSRMMAKSSAKASLAEVK